MPKDTTANTPPPLSRTTWSRTFDLSPGSTKKYTLAQTLARGTQTLALLYPSPNSLNAIIRVLKYIVAHIRKRRGMLIRDISLSAEAVTKQVERDLLLGVGNSFVEPRYCADREGAGEENAVAVEGVLGVILERLEDGEELDGREGDGEEVEEDAGEEEEVDLEVPEPAKVSSEEGREI